MSSEPHNSQHHPSTGDLQRRQALAKTLLTLAKTLLTLAKTLLTLL